MRFPAPAADLSRAQAAASATVGAEACEALPDASVDSSVGFHFALETRPPPLPPSASREDLDRLIHQVHLHCRDPDATAQAADAMRHTIENALWRGAQRGNGRLHAIHAHLLGPATGLFVADRLRSLACKVREWLILVSSPRRILWAVTAAWQGEDITAFVRQRASWHSIDEIAVYQRDHETPLVRVGRSVPDDEDDWLASSPLFCVSKRHLAETAPPDPLRAGPDTPEMPMHTMTVVGERSEISARVTGHAPSGFKLALQSMCKSADEILGDRQAGRAEWVFRLKQLVTPALKTSGPHVAEHFWNPLVILTVFLTAGAALLGSAGVGHLRWQGIVAQLDAEPGIEVISHSAAWGHRRIEILRDPQARKIPDLLLQMGCDAAAIAIRERSFISADDAIVAARLRSQPSSAQGLNVGARESQKPSTPASSPATNAVALEATARDQLLTDMRLDLLRSVLDLPREVGLSLSDGILTARGMLGEPAYGGLVRAPRRLAWIKKTDLSQLRDLTGENISALQKGLEKTKIEFVPASAILPEASKLRLQSIASEMVLLAGDARLKQMTVNVQFCATHPAMDRDTIENRVSLIRRDLERQGVPSAWFQPAADLLDAPTPHVVALRLNLESPPPEP